MSQEFRVVPAALLELAVNALAGVAPGRFAVEAELRAVVDASVPPAGGDVEVYAWVWVEELDGEEVNDGISFGPEKPDFAARNTGPTTFNYAPVYTQHVVTRLQAEVGALQQRLNVANEQVDILSGGLRLMTSFGSGTNIAGVKTVAKQTLNRAISAASTPAR